MSLSVIISTYNQPDWLRLCLLGYSHQTFVDFEILLADDGSDSRTTEVVDWARRSLKLNLTHLRQQDRGFRKCRILNKAIQAAATDYLLFTDGDCIPRHDFVQEHWHARQRGFYLSGGYIKLNEQASLAIGAEQVANGDFCRRRWLVQHGYPRLKNVPKLVARGRMADLLNRYSRTRAGWHGHNASCWRTDALAVNGFDERMGWGGEDREFGYRLVNLGIVPRRIRYSAICVHLFHERPWRDAGVLRQNDRLRRESLDSGRIRAQQGIDRLRRGAESKLNVG